MKAFAEYWQDKGDEKQETAQSILDARAKYPDCSLADLYDVYVQAHAKKGRAKPYPRPGAKKGKSVGKGAIPISDFMDWWSG